MPRSFAGLDKIEIRAAQLSELLDNLELYVDVVPDRDLDWLSMTLDQADHYFTSADITFPFKKKTPTFQVLSGNGFFGPTTAGGFIYHPADLVGDAPEAAS